MTEWWKDFPWRQIQTNLREIDMLDIDAEQVVRDLQEFKANILLINAAGVLASYPTQLDFHFQSPYLQGDSLADIIEACHAADIRVAARTDFSKVRRPLYEAHPEWAYISPAGELVDYNGDVHVCINGDFQQVYTPHIIEEMLTKLPFDGIFFNMGGYITSDYSYNYYGPCQCDNCKRLFDEMFGLELPVVEDMSDPVFRKYTVFKHRTQHDTVMKIYNFIHERWPNVCIANHGEATGGFVRQESNTAIARALPHWQYSGSDNTKRIVGSYPRLVSSNTTVDFIDYQYRHVAVSPDQQKLRLAQSLANGGALDYYLIGRLDNHEDRSGFAPVKEMFHYHAKNEDAYKRLESCAHIALINHRRDAGAEYRGWFRFLAENHHLFDSVLDEFVTEPAWERYDTIILPDYQSISDEMAAILDSFVESGGTLVATGRSGFYDEAFELREEPALRCMGVDRLKYVREDMTSAYIKLDDKTGQPRFADVDLLYVDGPYAYATYAEEAELHGKLIPPHNFGPPERCYYELVTDEPGWVVHPYGKGKVVYVPWLPGALFHRQGYPNTFEFAADLLENFAGLTPLGGNLSPQVEVTMLARGDGYELIHLVNGSGHFGVSFFAPLPMYDLEVIVPREQKSQSVRSLVTKQAYDVAYANGKLTIRVPKLEAFDAIVVE